MPVSTDFKDENRRMPKEGQDATGKFQAGNTLQPGKTIETPEEMWALFLKYKNWAKENPRVENVVIQKEMTTMPRELERPLTWEGFDIWLFENGIIGDIDDYRKNSNNAYTPYQPILKKVGNTIKAGNIEGAITGLFNSNLVARYIGLADKAEVSQNGSIAVHHKQVETTKADEQSDEVG